MEYILGGSICCPAESAIYNSLLFWKQCAYPVKFCQRIVRTLWNRAKFSGVLSIVVYPRPDCDDIDFSGNKGSGKQVSQDYVVHREHADDFSIQFLL